MDGIINVYKERGFTSHDVVAKLRGILKQKKIGHTGTLDPEAEGVLPVCLGKATRACDMLSDSGKEYRAVLLLGRETDTQDVFGRTLSEKEVSVTEEEAREAVMGFEGDYSQIPPMYSALKVDGKKLYQLARQGKEVERKARTVTIHRILIEKISLPRITMAVSCSKGTYIRTLCHDIGKRLGCGGCMESLTRTRVSGFTIDRALTLGQIEALRDEGRLSEAVLPVDALFSDYPAFIPVPEAERLLRNGNPLEASMLEAAPGEGKKEPDGVIRVYSREGGFAGLYEYDGEKRRFRAKKMFFLMEGAEG